MVRSIAQIDFAFPEDGQFPDFLHLIEVASKRIRVQNLRFTFYANRTMLFSALDNQDGVRSAATAIVSNVRDPCRRIEATE